MLFVVNFVARCVHYCYKSNPLVKANMVSTRKKKQSNSKLMSQLEDFDMDVIIGDAANSGQQNVVVNDGTDPLTGYLPLMVVVVFQQPTRMQRTFKHCKDL